MASESSRSPGVANGAPRSRLDRPRILPFAVTIAAALTLVPFTGQHFEPFGWWIGIALVVASGAIAIASGRVRDRTWTGLILPGAVFLGGVGWIRDATGGSTGGCGALVMIPVIWTAWAGTKQQIGVAAFGAAAVLVVPILLIGGPRYPEEGWRSALILIAATSLAGFATERLRTELARQSDELAEREQEMRSTLDAMPHPIARFHAVYGAGTVVDLRCTFLNSAGRQVLGDDAVGTLASVYLGAAGRPTSLPRWIAAIGRPTPERYEVPAPVRGGEPILYEIELVGLPDGVMTSWRDVTDARRATSELQGVADLWQSVAGVAADAVLTLDSQGRVLFMSAPLREMVGITKQVEIGQPVFEAIHPDDRKLVARSIAIAATSDVRQIVEFRFLGIDRAGEPLVLEARVNGADGADGRQIHASLRNVTVAHQERAELDHAASHDRLTGLLNRAGFDDAVRRRLETVGASTFVLYIDLDRFKPINDRYGHAAGDLVLCEIGRRLSVDLREGDGAARIGGDEFAVFGTGPMRDDQLDSLVARVDAIVRARVEVAPGEWISVGASVGVAYSWPGATVEALVSAADTAMYRVKHDRYLVAEADA